jgi:hypothetical protein
MGWLGPVSTENANYYLIYGSHLLESWEDPIERSDAIILETGALDPKFFEKKVASHPQYKRIIAHAIDTSKRIWTVDTPPTLSGELLSFLKTFGGVYVGVESIFRIGSRIKKKKMSRREFLRESAVLLGSLALADTMAHLSAVSLSPGGKLEGRELVAAWTSETERILPTPLIELRDLISAYKTEGYVSPYIKSTIKRRPNIALVYGAHHAGILDRLKNMEDTKRSLDLLMKYMGWSIEKENLDLAYENWYDGKWIQKVHKTNLMLDYL